jgi:hypothetical protein
VASQFDRRLYVVETEEMKAAHAKAAKEKEDAKRAKLAAEAELGAQELQIWEEMKADYLEKSKSN